MAEAYKGAYSGLSGTIWMLSLVMLINRAGSMVLPFLSVYLKEGLGMELREVGIIMSVYGLGSMCGSYFGGWLSDRIGHFYVQFGSLVLGGCLFILLSGVSEFPALVTGVFLVSVVAESLRPANAASIAYYAREGNITQAFSLNRMAVNLGFSIGPALGGLLAAISFRWLFIADGITCILAGLLFYGFFRHRRGYVPQKKELQQASAVQDKSPYRDGVFVLFILLCTGFAILFFQLFTTLPLYYREVYALSEQKIGGLLALNGLIVFLLEMVMVYMIGNRLSLRGLIVVGTVMTGAAYALLNLGTGMWVLAGSVLLLSVAEILAMPFMATLVVRRSGASTRGAYMGMYSLAYSSALVVAPFIGTRIIEAAGYRELWWFVGVAGVLLGAGFYMVTGKIIRPAEPLRTAEGEAA